MFSQEKGEIRLRVVMLGMLLSTVKAAPDATISSILIVSNSFGKSVFANTIAMFACSPPSSISFVLACTVQYMKAVVSNGQSLLFAPPAGSHGLTPVSQPPKNGLNDIILPPSTGLYVAADIWFS